VTIKATTPSSGDVPGTASPADVPNPSNLVVEAYFPTLVAFEDFPDASSLNAHLEKSIYALKAEDPAGIVRSNAQRVGAWHSATGIHRRPEFTDFATRVTAVADAYLSRLGATPDRPAICDDMWANVSGRHAYNSSHNHGKVLLSGVYYVRADPEKSGNINLYDPRVQAIRTPIYTDEAKKTRSHTWPRVFFPPTPGRVILFPGWLRHDVEPNLSDAEGKQADRISIAFNFYQRGPGSGA
jgi:uncharacterized protein (TIGR02466 family)